MPLNPAPEHCITSQDACLFRAAALMQQALGLLDQAGESRAATHLQHALDTLDLRLPLNGQVH